MEESLDNIVKEIDSLVSIKDEVRKKLFETHLIIVEYLKN